MSGHTDATGRHLVLTGPMGAGKTTVGRELASRLGRPFFDSDIQIQRQYGVSARMLAQEKGVGWLHDIEAAVLVAALESDTPAVIAAAASVAEHPLLPELVPEDKAVMVLLIGEPVVLAARAESGFHRRSVSTEEYRQISQRRARRVAPLAEHTVDVTALTHEQVVESILHSCFPEGSSVNRARETP